MTGPDEAATASTRIDVTGANCPWCFNAALDRLRAAPTVASVRGSIAEQLVIVDHSGVDDDELLTIVRDNLHVDARSSGEHVQAAVEPIVTDVPCPHCEADSGRHSGRTDG